MAEHIPLEKCKIDERFMLRMEYDIDSLAESIHRYGQLQPGIGYMNEQGEVMVYMGVRRLLAARRSHELYGTPDTYYVTIMPKVNDIDIWNQILAENEERRSLSMLDKLHLVSFMSHDMLSKIIDPHIIKDLISVSATVPIEIQRDWLAMERITGTRLTLGQMRALSTLPDRWSMVVGAYVVLKNHFTENAIRAVDFATFLLVHDTGDSPAVSEYLRVNGITAPGLPPEPPAPHFSNSKYFIHEAEKTESETHKETSEAREPAKTEAKEVQTKTETYNEPSEAKEPAKTEVKAYNEPSEVRKPEVQNEAEDTNVVTPAEENLPIILISITDEPQIFTCTKCGQKYKLVISK
ncbi:MAG: ParB N-terminal domain-containing protein [Conexivisphaerales archaeon]